MEAVFSKLPANLCERGSQEESSLVAAQLEESAVMDSDLHRSSLLAEEPLAESAAEAPKKKMRNHCG